MYTIFSYTFMVSNLPQDSLGHEQDSWKGGGGRVHNHIQQLS